MATYDGLFDDWPEAYDLCREVNRPIVATVTEDGITETCKIYPSGSCKVLLTTRKRITEDPSKEFGGTYDEWCGIDNGS